MENLPAVVQEIENPLENINPDTPDIGKSSAKYIPLGDIVELISGKGLTYQQAGKILGITKQAVHERCQKHGVLSANSLKLFKNNKATILEAKQAQVLYFLDQDSIKSMSGLQKTTAFGILYDKLRLERNESTANVAHLHAAAAKNAELLKKFTGELSQSVLDAAREDEGEDGD